MRPFEIGLVAVFVIAALGGLAYLATIKGGSSSEVKAYGDAVSIWGTMDSSKVGPLIKSIGEVDKQFGAAVSYRELDERSFENDIVNAIAEGNPPDLILLPHDMLVTFRSKLFPIPFESYPVSTFQSEHIDGASIFVLPDGTYGVPVGVDPLVLYYNRDLLANAGMAEPPKTWESLLNNAVPRLTKTDNRRNLLQSAVGMGEFLNVRNAKEILSMLLLQSGISIIDAKEKTYMVTLAYSQAQGLPPAHAALNFYTQFASPTSNAFSWNRSQQFDRNAFTAGKLAFYFGFQSERTEIEEENPNLNFAVARIPQGEGVSAERNYGTFYALAIPKTGRNINGAYTAAFRMASADVAGMVAETLGVTPTLRALYGVSSDALYGSLFEDSALIARGWLDPSPKDSRSVFKAMIEEVTFGRGDAVEAISDAAVSLEELFK